MKPSMEEATRRWTAIQPNVAAFISTMVTDLRHREDILQDCAVAVLSSYDRYDRKRPFLTWTLGIARNQIYNYYRTQKNKPLVFDTQTVESLSTAFAETSKTEPTIIEHLKRCIEELDLKSRQICELRYQKNLRPKEIAQRLESAPNTISKSLQRTRNQLGHCIQLKSMGELR